MTEKILVELTSLELEALQFCVLAHVTDLDNIGVYKDAYLNVDEYNLLKKKLASGAPQ